MKHSTRLQLQQAQSMEEYLKIISDNYDLKTAKLYPSAKIILGNQIEKVLALVGAKEK